MAENYPANTLFRSWFDLKVSEMREPTHYMLACRSCGAFLSNPVRSVSTYDQFHAHCDSEVDGVSITAGWFLVPNAELRRACRKEGELPAVISGSLMNLEDLTPTARYIRPRHKLVGCCGIDGFDGPNRTCPCGAIIGTEFSECFQTQRFEPYMKNTEWVRLDTEELAK